jgi:hypothetical protein
METASLGAALLDPGEAEVLFGWMKNCKKDFQTMSCPKAIGLLQRYMNTL